MKLNKIHIQNFFSVQNLRIDFTNYTGITLIEGKIGAGKSTCIEAVVWALTGKTVRKSTEESMVNNRKPKNLVVTLWVNGNIKIVRGRRPTKLELYVDGKEVTTDHASRTQDKIDELLNINYRVVLSSLVFGQHNTVNFLSATAEEKRKIIKTFLNIDDIFKYRETIKELKSKKNILLKSCKAVKEAYAKDKSSLEDQKNKFSKKLDELPAKELIEKFTYEQLKQQEEEAKRTLAAAVQAKKEADYFLGKKEELEKILRSGKIEKGNEICPTCGTSIPKVYELGKYGKTKLEIDIENERQSYQDWLDVEEREMSKYKKQKPKISLSKFNEFENSYNKIKQSIETFEGLIEEKDKAILLEEEKETLLKSEYDMLRFWELAFSEKGMIKYIIRNILDYFNERCNYYLSLLTNGRYSILFDEELSETIVTDKTSIKYVSLSGGEGQKFNLAVMLALQSLLAITEKEKSNIVFIDEVTTYLDNEGIEGVFHLLQELKKEKDIFLITHEDMLKDLLADANRLTVKKKNGITTLANAGC